MTAEVTTNDILSGLGELSVTRNDKLIVHASLSSFGHVNGGAPAVILALQRAVGPGGVLMTPTFTYGHEPFDIARSPSKTGRISEEFRLSPDVVRSGHPGFSVAVWGERAEDLAGGHETEAGIGKGTPIHRMVDQGAKILLIGVDHTANSTLHLTQELANAPYLDRPRMTQISGKDGKLTPFRMRRAGCSLGFGKMQAHIDEHGIEKTARIGESTVTITSAGPLVELAVKLQIGNPAFLLCDRDGCPSCSEARDMIAAARTGEKKA